MGELTIGENTDLVWILEEVDALSNVLKAIAKFKRYFPQRWPSKVTLSVHNRLGFGLGSDTKVVRKDHGYLMDAMHMSLWEPIVDLHGGKRQAASYKGERVGLGCTYRRRHDAK